MGALIRVTDEVLKAMLKVLGLVMVVCVIWQVASRYVLGTPSTLTDELGRFSLMWFAMLSAAYVLGQRRHLAIDLFAEQPAGVARRLRLLGLTALIALVALVMLVGGWRLAMQTLASGQVTPVLRMPMGYIYFAVPLSALLMLVYCLDIARTSLGSDALGPNDPIQPKTMAE